MRDRNLERDIAYIKDMLLYIERAREVIPRANRYGIPLDDDMVISSISMNLGQVGEQLSSGKLSDEIKEKYSHIVSWQKIKGFRNFIYHNYGNLDYGKIRTILERVLPETEEQLEYILRDLRKELSEE
ncbi:HepT-like ribonuclease domain-containing protein [Streptococcus suis]